MADEPGPLQRHQLRASVFASYWGALTGLLIPIAIAWATYSFNANQLFMTERQSCIKQHADITNMIYDDKNVADERREERHANLLAHADLLVPDCAAVNIALPGIVRINIGQAFQDAETKAVADAAIKVLQQDAKASGVDSPELKAAQAGPPPRIYIYISASEQLPPATELKARLQQSRVGDAQVRVPAIQIKSSGAARSVLRWFRLDERDEAQKILDRVNGLLEQPKVQLEDLSSHPELTIGDRPRHYELWFGLGAIKLRS